MQTLPLNLENAETVIRIDGHEVSDDHPPHQTDFNVVSAGYFQAMRRGSLSSIAQVIALLRYTSTNFWRDSCKKTTALSRPPKPASWPMRSVAEAVHRRSRRRATMAPRW